MATSDNLSHFLYDVADAIREATGETDLINAQAFSAKIRELSTGGSTGVGLKYAKERTVYLSKVTFENGSVQNETLSDTAKEYNIQTIEEHKTSENVFLSIKGMFFPYKGSGYE
jgi:hypothetical protein